MCVYKYERFFTLCRPFLPVIQCGIYLTIIYQIGDKFIIMHLLIIQGRSENYYVWASTFHLDFCLGVNFFFFGIGDTVISHHGIQRAFSCNLKLLFDRQFKAYKVVVVLPLSLLLLLLLWMPPPMLPWLVFGVKLTTSGNSFRFISLL